MRIVIHMGMHKTGSSAIQACFHATPVAGARYLRAASSNHSSLFVLLFDDPARVPRYHGFSVLGPDFVARLPENRRRGLAALEAQLAEMAASGGTLVISGEDISSPEFVQARQAMHDLLRRWSDDILVVAYVRSPLSYAVSAFQEQLKGPHRVDLDLSRAWPQYRTRFEQMEALVGPDRLRLRRFAPDALVGGDVVADFCHAIGVAPPSVPPARVNETLGLEATALLYLQRRLGRGFVGGFPGAHEANARFVALLDRPGGRRFTFAADRWAPVLAANRADLDWIEARLGGPLADAPPAGAVEIGCDEDLFAIAEAELPRLERMLATPLADSPPDPPPDPGAEGAAVPPLRARTLQALEALRARAEAGVRGRAGGNQPAPQPGPQPGPQPPRQPVQGRS